MATVKEIRDMLAGLPDDFPVYIQIDPEGNGFVRCQGAEEGMKEGDDYSPDSIIPPEAKEKPEEWMSDPEAEYVADCVVIFP